jgi:rubrerythrin
MTEQTKYKVEFPMCRHLEYWAGEKPKLARTIGVCPIHHYICPVCGFGVTQLPDCNCPERRIP